MKRVSYILFLFFAAFNAQFALGQGDDDAYAILRNSSRRTVIPSSISSYTVYAMAEDDRGMLWFGTNNGLFYFDNYNFVEFSYENEQNAQITSLLCVGDSLFVGTENGLTVFDLKNKKNSNLLTDRKINCFYEPVRGKVSIGTNAGLFDFDLKSGVITQIDDIKLNVNDIELDSEKWWIATDSGIFNRAIDGTVSIFNEMCAKSICVFDSEKIYIGTEKGMYLVENESYKLQQMPFSNGAGGILNPNVTDIIAFDDDELLVGTNGNGVFRFDVKNHSLINITRYGSVSLSLSDDYIIKLFRDSSDRLWIATALGINKMIKEYENFTSFSLSNGSTHNLPVRSIAQVTDNELFLGTDYGVFVFNKTKNSFTSFEDYYGIDDRIIATSRVSKVFYDRDRYLWIGTRYNGIFCYDTKDKRFLNWLPNFSNQVINDIENDNRGGIWIASDNGLSRVNIRERSCEPIYKGCSRGILCDGDFLYITTNKGLMRRNLEDGKTETFNVGEKNILYNITKGDDGNLYLGSYLDGVLIFDVNTNTFSVLANEKDGVSPIAYSVLFDSHGNAWVSTNRGIWEYDMTTKAISVYTYYDGLQGNDFTMDGAFRANSGMMYFGGFNGFSVFNPLIIKHEKTVPKVMVSKVNTSSGKDMMNIRCGDTIGLKNDDNSFIIDFSAYNLNKINKIRYKYILEGYDRQWNSVGSANHQAEYRNIPAGIYTFILIAANEADVQSVPYKLTIIVKPNWYDTVYFKVGVSLLLVLMILVIVYLIIRKERRKIAHVREIDELERKMFMLKGKALQMQMNPHFLYNTLNSIQSFILTNDSLKASLYLSSFARLMRKILNNASREKISLSEELESIRLYLDLEKLRLNDRFVYEINIDPEIDVTKVGIASMLLQPFAENAVIHGLANKAENGVLKIEVKHLNKTEILVVVEDNGIGRVKAAQKRRELGKTEESHATSITKQRLEILNEVSKGEYSVKIIDLYDDHGEACGTRVEIKICCHD